jgi:peptide/nickel transport system substrate-binding protein
LNVRAYRLGFIISRQITAHPLRSIFLNLIFLTALSAGCRHFSGEPPPGYLVVGIESYPLQLDPRYATDANSARVGELIYNGLLRIDAKSQLEPDVARRWSMPDARTYLFELRRGIVFHDGRPLTAADVKYTYESILEPKNLSPKRGLLKPLESIDVLDPYTIRFHLRAPHAPFIEQFTIGIVPATAQSANPAQTRPPPGSGPFVLDAMESGERVILKANNKYWDAKPAIAGLIFKAVPDAMVRVLEFKKGSIGFLQNDIEPDVIPWLKKNTDAVVEADQGTTFQYIGINCAHPILRNVKVRQALAHAIDRGAIIRRLMKDTAAEASGLLSPLNWAYEDRVERWPYDPKRARQLLDEAGYPDPDGAGPLARFRLSYKTTNIDLRRRIAEALKEQLAQVGIELEIRTYEWGTFFSDVKRGNFHLFSLAWVGIHDPDIYYQLFHSGSVPPNGDNRGRYRNARLDALLESGRTTNHLGERRQIYSEVQKVLADELPYIPLWWVKNVIVRRPALKGFVPYPDGSLISLEQVKDG